MNKSLLYMNVAGVVIVSEERLSQLIVECTTNAVEKVVASLNLVQNKDEEYGELLTLDQACKYLDLKRSTIYSLKCLDKIPWRKEGKKLSFIKSELDEWNANGRPANPSMLEAEVDELLATPTRRKKRW